MPMMTAAIMTKLTIPHRVEVSTDTRISVSVDVSEAVAVNVVI